MLGRYRIYRGKRPPDDPLPGDTREDTRKHTRHVLRPPEDLVVRFLSNPDPESWPDFEREYVAELDRRFARDEKPFAELAARARDGDVWLGCNCPTRKNPDVRHCHTFLALQYMKTRYPDLDVRFPGEDGS